MSGTGSRRDFGRERCRTRPLRSALGKWLLQGEGPAEEQEAHGESGSRGHCIKQEDAGLTKEKGGDTGCDEDWPRTKGYMLPVPLLLSGAIRDLGGQELWGR